MPSKNGGLPDVVRCYVERLIAAGARLPIRDVSYGEVGGAPRIRRLAGRSCFRHRPGGPKPKPSVIMHGRSTYRTLILAVALSGLLQAITLRSHDGGDGHVVSTPAAVAHSGLFGNLIGDRDEWCCDDDVFTLPAMNTGADVLMIAEFVNNTDAHDVRIPHRMSYRPGGVST